MEKIVDVFIFVPTGETNLVDNRLCDCQRKELYTTLDTLEIALGTLEGIDVHHATLGYTGTAIGWRETQVTKAQQPR